MSIMSFNLGELTEYCHHDDIRKLIDIFGERILSVMQSYTLYSKYDIKYLSMMTSLKKLYVSMRTISPKEMTQILKIPNIMEIECLIYNGYCYLFDSEYKGVSDIVDFSHMTKLKKLTIGCQFKGLDKLTNLRTLKIKGFIEDELNLNNLTSLRKLKIENDENKNISRQYNFTELTNLEYFKLTDRAYKGTLDLSKCKKLKYVKMTCANPKCVFGYMPDLMELYINNVIIEGENYENMNGTNFPNLERLTLYNNYCHKNDFGNLTKLRKLHFVSLCETKINLMKNINLTSLSINYNDPDYDDYFNKLCSSTIKGLGKLYKLTKLKIAGIGNYLKLDNLVNIQILKYSDCPNIHGMRKLTKLTKLRCDNFPMQYLEKLTNLHSLSCYPYGAYDFIRFDKIHDGQILNNITELKIVGYDRVIGIKKLVNLRKLKLKMHHIPIGLKTLNNLQYLSITEYMDVENEYCSCKFEKTVNVSKMTQLKYFEMELPEINEIVGLENCKKLNSISIINNNIKNIDVTNCDLSFCYMQGNKLHCIGISNNKNVRELICGGGSYVFGITIDGIPNMFPRLREICYIDECINKNEGEKLRLFGIAVI